MTIEIKESIKLELIISDHAEAIFQLAKENRNYLLPWLPWVANMKSVDFISTFIEASTQRNKEGQEFSFVIIENSKVIGRIGIYKIDRYNKIAEIGYWIGEHHAGKGIVTKTCMAIIRYCFTTLNINRIEIKCATDNFKSQTIPQKLGFLKEGIIRDGEFLGDKFVDLYCYSLLQKDYEQVT